MDYSFFSSPPVGLDNTHNKYGGGTKQDINHPVEDLDVHTLFTTNQLSNTPRSITKILFFTHFLIFLEQNQLYYCLLYDYENICCICEVLIIDICIMNLEANQVLLLQENGEISVLLIVLQDTMTNTTAEEEDEEVVEGENMPVRQEKKMAEDDGVISDIGESKVGQPSPPLIHLSKYSQRQQSRGQVKTPPNFSSQNTSPLPQSHRSPPLRQKSRSFPSSPYANHHHHQNSKNPLLIQESLRINIQQFGFIITPQMIFAQATAATGGNSVPSTNAMIKLQYFGNSSMILISNQIKCTIIQLTVNDQDGSIRVEQSFDIEDHFLSHSIISSIWISSNFYHILSCNNDCILNLTILPKKPELFQLTEEQLKQITLSDNEDENDSQSSHQRKPIFQQLKLNTKHTSWISSLSLCSNPTCLYGMSGDIDGHLVLWKFEEKNYQFVNTLFMLRRMKQRKKERSGEEEEDEEDSLQSLNNKNHWKILWHDQTLADRASITMIKLETFQPSFYEATRIEEGVGAGKEEDSVQYYAYIGTNRGKFIILQLFQKSYHLLHELYLFSSIGEINTLHITFENKAGTASIASPQAPQHRLPPAASQISVQQRLRVYSAQSCEAIECIVNKHIASIIKLLPTFSLDNNDIDSLTEMFSFEADDEDYQQNHGGGGGFGKGEFKSVQFMNDLNNPTQMMTSEGVLMNISNSNQSIANPDVTQPTNRAFSTTMNQFQKMIEFPHYQYSRFYQYNKRNTLPKSFQSSLKAFTLLIEKDMILVTDWLQYYYLYDLFSGQLLHTIESPTMHCVLLASFEFSSAATVEAGGIIDPVKKDRILVLGGHQDGTIYLYELIIRKLKQNGNKKSKKKNKKDFQNPSVTGSLVSAMSSVRINNFEQFKNDQDENDDEDENDEGDDDDASVGLNDSLANRKKKNEENVDMGVFDLLEDSSKLLERRYSLESEEQGDIAFLSMSDVQESVNEHSFGALPLGNGINPPKAGNSIKALSNQPSYGYYCESNLLFTVPSIHCPTKMTHLFFSNQGNYFISIHLTKFLFLYSTSPPLALSQLNLASPAVTRTINNYNNTTSGFDTRTMILKSFIFGEGLRKITVLQPINHDDQSHHQHDHQNPATSTESKGGMNPERLILVLQYPDRIELFDALSCSVLTKMNLHETTVRDILQASYLWYYPANHHSNNNNKTAAASSKQENKLIGLSIQDLSSIYSCSYGKGFEKILSSIYNHSFPTSIPSFTSSWEYLLQGMQSFTSLSSPLLSLWSMKRCSFLRIHFQSQNNSIHIMRTKQFETITLPANQKSFLEIIGVQSLKTVPWIRNHRGIVILSNGYAVVIRF